MNTFISREPFDQPYFLAQLAISYNRNVNGDKHSRTVGEDGRRHSFFTIEGDSIVEDKE